MTKTPLWRCPVCGQRFVTRNMPHSCEVIALDAYFENAKPELRDLFDRFVAAVRENGLVTVNATKSRVALQGRGRFAGIERPRKDYLVASFLMTTPIQSARLTRVEYLPPYYYVHRLRLRQPADIDSEVKRWLAQAYQVGAQRHVRNPDWPMLRQPPNWVHLPREVADAITRGEDPSIVSTATTQALAAYCFSTIRALSLPPDGESVRTVAPDARPGRAATVPAAASRTTAFPYGSEHDPPAALAPPCRPERPRWAGSADALQSSYRSNEPPRAAWSSAARARVVELGRAGQWAVGCTSPHS